eukprot:TsM_001223700 transcript=TsM_001223700 gene=TsM_001223700
MWSPRKHDLVLCHTHSASVSYACARTSLQLPTQPLRNLCGISASRSVVKMDAGSTYNRVKLLYHDNLSCRHRHNQVADARRKRIGRTEKTPPKSERQTNTQLTRPMVNSPL